ncbi:MAG: hypothetical protein QM495_03595 [Lutibacter sp.]|uniref:hypothetical protein n=1 Tax=Lutibacter sp. TaxID=1925666 RepID=UPI00385D603F
MKKIFKLFVAVSLLLVYSCNDNADYNTDDYLTGTASEGGAIVAVNKDTGGKLLGIPSSTDFATATVSFAASELDFSVILMSGGNDVSGYEIMKSLNGGTEVSVATSTTLPISLSYSTPEEFVSNLGIAPTDLRIGDVISFRTKMIRTDGSVEFAGPNEGTFSVTISCSSDLAGTYHLTVVRSNGPDVIFPNEKIIEVSPGVYKTESIYKWDVGSIAPDQGFNFQDICGELTVPEQGLAQGYYSNVVIGTEPGFVDGATGDLKIFYSVDFASGPVTCIGTYVKL